MRADRSGKVLTHECEQALWAICEFVVITSQRVCVATNDEVNAWRGCIAVDGVLPVERRNDGQLLGTHGLCKALHLISGDHHEGGAGVNDTPLGGADRNTVHLHIIEGNLPVASHTWNHLDHRNVGEVTSVAGRVHSAKSELTVGTARPEVEREHW